MCCISISICALICFVLQVVLEAKSETQLRNLAEKLSDASISHKLWIEQPEDVATALATAPCLRDDVSHLFKKFNLCKATLSFHNLRTAHYSALHNAWNNPCAHSSANRSFSLTGCQACSRSSWQLACPATTQQNEKRRDFDCICLTALGRRRTNNKAPEQGKELVKGSARCHASARCTGMRRQGSTGTAGRNLVRSRLPHT